MKVMELPSYSEEVARIRLGAAFVLLSLTAMAVSLGCSGDVIDLGVPGAYGSYVTDVDDAGEVAGHWLMDSGERLGFIYRDERFVIVSPTGLSDVQLFAINNRGQAAGAAAVGTTGRRHAMLYEEVDGVRDLGTLGGMRSHPTDINDAGQVVGWSEIAVSEENCCCVPIIQYCGAVHAFLWTDGQMVDLGTLGGGSSRALRINEQGQIVGPAELAGDGELSHAFLYENGGMTDLGTLGGVSSWPTDLNESGEVVGWSDVSMGGSVEHAFLYRDGHMLDLGTLGGQSSRAHAINDTGLVAGAAQRADGVWRAFLWDDGVMTDLGTVEPNGSEATHLNNAGQVLGSFDFMDDDPLTQDRRPFLWDRGILTDLLDRFPSVRGSGLGWAFSGLSDAGDILYTTDTSLVLFGLPLTDPHLGKPHSYVLRVMPSESF